MSTQIEMLARMLEAKHILDAIPKPEPCIRLHPDDYEALLRQVPMLKNASENERLRGLPVFIDESAPKLPRKNS